MAAASAASAAPTAARGGSRLKFYKQAAAIRRQKMRGADSGAAEAIVEGAVAVPPQATDAQAQAPATSQATWQATPAVQAVPAAGATPTTQACSAAGAQNAPVASTVPQAGSSVSVVKAESASAAVAAMPSVTSVPADPATATPVVAPNGMTAVQAEDAGASGTQLGAVVKVEDGAAEAPAGDAGTVAAGVGVDEKVEVSAGSAGQGGASCGAGEEKEAWPGLLPQGVAGGEQAVVTVAPLGTCPHPELKGPRAPLYTSAAIPVASSPAAANEECSSAGGSGSVEDDGRGSDSSAVWRERPTRPRSAPGRDSGSWQMAAAKLKRDDSPSS